MTTVTVSPKYQIVIPKEIRNTIDIKPGQKFQIFKFGNRLELIPVMDIKDARGMFEGMGLDSTIEHEPDREL